MTLQSFETFKTANSHFDDDISGPLDPLELQHTLAETHKPVNHISKINVQASITCEKICYNKLWNSSRHRILKLCRNEGILK
jgi:hypothetical protein